MKPFNKIKNGLFCIIIILFVGHDLIGQRTELGFGIGGNNYWGDLEPESVGKNILLISSAFHISLKQDIIHNFNFRANLHIGNLSGGDKNANGKIRQRRNLDFQTPIRELFLALEYELWDLNDPKYTFTPYGGAGVGIFKFNPKTEYTFQDGRTRTIELQPLGTEGQGLAGFAPKYDLRAFSFPIIGGLKFKYGEKIYITLEIIARYTNTDYLDDVSTDYLPTSTFPDTPEGQLASYLNNRIDEFLGLPENDPEAIELATKRGSITSNDFFHSGMATIYIKLGSGKSRGKRKVKCYSF